MIGIMDSGVGGLTVLKELRTLLPGEGFLYFGDNANNPFGNRSKDELLSFNRRMLDFFRARSVAAAVIACNTTSVLEELLQAEYDFPLLGIIRPIVRRVCGSGLERVGVVATRFTIESGAYRRLIKAGAPRIAVYEKADYHLAGMIDRGEFNSPALVEEVAKIGEWIKTSGVDHVILACTHYPVVREVFESAAPGVTFLDPAVEQAETLAAIMKKKKLLRNESGKTVIFTSGNPALFPPVLEKLGLPPGECPVQRFG
ncbi:MAG: glutamate racemase [Treponema sp.]|nr:glutamate racemase [Treponema sp.]